MLAVGNQGPRQRLPWWVKAVLAFWVLLMVPWFLTIYISGRFAASDDIRVKIFFGSMLMYPPSVMLAILFRRKRPVLLFLPALSLAPWIASSFIH